MSAGPTPPTEIAVTFGVQLGQDLKLGIVNGSGQAHLTVTATWSLEATAPAPRANDHHPDGDGSPRPAR